MGLPSLPSILENVQRRLRPSLSGVVTDADLLERFLRKRDQAAFELLMWRHGPMVFGVCRRVLHHTQDAEDAFQAAFLTLARKAGSIGKRESLSGWLYMVAYRIALRVRARSARRGQVEKPLDDLPIDPRSSDPADVTAWRELRRVVDAELSQIPEKYRTAFILCHLEGKTCEEAAEHLGCPRGTIQSRVGRARERLRNRLALRGWMPGSSSLAQLLEEHGSPLASVSPVLVYATVQAALLAALGQALAGVSASVIELMNETVSAMRLRKLLTVALLALLALLGSSAAVAGMMSRQPEKKLDATYTPCHSSSAPQPAQGGDRGQPGS
jgi:RNA polymerase sigma factor (sigma-70 family)